MTKTAEGRRLHANAKLNNYTLKRELPGAAPNKLDFLSDFDFLLVLLIVRYTKTKISGLT